MHCLMRMTKIGLDSDLALFPIWYLKALDARAKTFCQFSS